MNKIRYALVVLVLLITITRDTCAARKTTRIKIRSMHIHSNVNSTGQKIQEITIVTCQDRVEMWGILTVYVQMQDKAGNIYFGSDSFPQPRRNSGTSSVDKWVFHVVTEKLDHPKLTGVWAIYKNSIDAKNHDDKKKLVKAKNLNDWVKSNAKAKKLAVQAEFHQILY